jgi:hypothetical protein
MLGNRFLDVVGHVPVAATAADVAHETGIDLAPLERMRDFGMELHGVEAARFVGHGGDRRRFVAADELEAGRQFGDLVAVAHPDFEQAVALGIGPVLDAVEQFRMPAGAHLGVTEFALVAAFDLTAELRRHGLHAVADAEHRHAQLEHDVGRLPFLGFIDRVGASGKDDALRLEFADELLADIEGMQFAIHLLLAHAAGNELRDLRTEIEDENLLVSHGGNP